MYESELSHDCFLDMLWPYSGSTCVTMENSVQTTLRLRALARGPVWIRQSFLKGSTLREGEGAGERQTERKTKRERERKANMVKLILVKNQQ